MHYKIYFLIIHLHISKAYVNCIKYCFKSELIDIFNYTITIVCIINYYSIIYNKLLITSYSKNSKLAYRKLYIVWGGWWCGWFNI